MDNKKITELLTTEERRIRTAIDDLERGGLVGHTGQHEHLEPPEDRTMDGGSELAERSFQLGQIGLLESELDDLAAARERLSQGTYGRCSTCGVEIAEERLLALPTTQFCVNHSVGT